MRSFTLFLFFQSGKLVMKMFQKIQELIEDPQALVCVLIDEVCCLGISSPDQFERCFFSF